MDVNHRLDADLPRLRRALSWGLGAFIFIYAFEAPIRYWLSKGHLDEAIFLRDIMLGLPVFSIFFIQALRGKVQPIFWIYFFIIGFHGLIIFINFHSVPAIVYGAKLFLPVLAGAVAYPAAFNPSRRMAWFLGIIWFATAMGVYLDKYVIDFPWFAMHTKIEGMDVDISRDWQIGGTNKRAGGFTRSSISAATIESLLGFTVLYNARRLPTRFLVAVITLVTLYLTTQKGTIVAFGVAYLLMTVWPSQRTRLLKGGLFFFMIACIALPIVLPQYEMPRGTSGMFSLASFYDRIQQMWPDGWRWIKGHELFPFGVGMGGISGAQRMYDPVEATWADNLFVFMYAYFGVLAFVYIGAVAFKALQVPRDASRMGLQALTVLVFIFGYGCAISGFEDQMFALFFGVSISAMAREIKRVRVVTATAALRSRAELVTATLAKRAQRGGWPAIKIGPDHLPGPTR